MIEDPEDPFHVSMTDPFRPIAKKFYDTWGNMELAQYAANGDSPEAAEARRRLSDRDGYGLIFMAGEAWRDWEGHVSNIIHDLRRENEELRCMRGRENVADIGNVAEILAGEFKRLLADEPPDSEPTADSITDQQTSTDQQTTEPTDTPTTEPTDATSSPPWLIDWDD